MKLTEPETKQLKKLLRGKRLNRFYGESVEPLFTNKELKTFCEDLFKNRGVKNPSLLEVGVFGFKHVSMHIDAMYGPDYRVMLIFLQGCGELAHFTDVDTIKYSEISEKYQIVVLDDNRPHAFKHKGRQDCAALLFGVHKTYIDAIEKSI